MRRVFPLAVLKRREVPPLGRTGLLATWEGEAPAEPLGLVFRQFG